MIFAYLFVILLCAALVGLIYATYKSFNEPPKYENPEIAREEREKACANGTNPVSFWALMHYFNNESTRF